MPAMYAALFVALAKTSRQLVCGGLAAALGLGLYGARYLGLHLGSHWFIVLASLAAATLAVCVFPTRESGADGGSETNGESRGGTVQDGGVRP
jgi:hypothetical protein